MWLGLEYKRPLRRIQSKLMLGKGKLVQVTKVSSKKEALHLKSHCNLNPAYIQTRKLVMVLVHVIMAT